MTDLSAEYKALAEYRPVNKVRFVTAASLFDGHDASINIMRRLLQATGCRTAGGGCFARRGLSAPGWAAITGAKHGRVA
jgi:methylmalonyl-CoA mutase cobalamin-binding subunit